MNEASLVNNLPLNGDLKSLRIGEEIAPIELSKTRVRIQNLDVTGDFNIAGQDDNLLDRVGTKTYVKNTGDYFGIGTTSPDRRLHLYGATDDTLAQIESGTDYCKLKIIDSNDTAHIGLRGSVNTLSIGFNENIHADNLNILSSGNVGIGTTSPDRELDVEGQYPNVRITSDATGHNNYADIGFDSSGGAPLIISNQANTDILFKVSAGNIRMVIDDDARISLSNNDSGASNTIFGYTSGANIASGGDKNTLFGKSTGYSISTGDNNTNVGWEAGYYNATGINNTAIGSGAMMGASGQSNSYNTAIGYYASKLITTGGSNVTIGNMSGYALTTGGSNVVIGSAAGDAMTDNNYNVAVGVNAFGAADSGEEGNTLLGHHAGSSINDGGSHYNVILGYTAGTGGTGAMLKCVAIGKNAMTSTAGNAQTGTVAIGNDALKALTSGAGNTAIGYEALKNIVTGDSNVAIGYEAAEGFENAESYNVVIGYEAMTSMDEGYGGGDVDGNIAIGYQALKGGDLSSNDRQIVGNIAIGKSALVSTGTNAQTGIVAIGYESLKALTSGTGNTAIGYHSLNGITTGEKNTAIGYGAMDGAGGATVLDSDNNTFIGYNTGGGTWVNTKCEYNVGIGNYVMDAAMDGALANTGVGYSALGKLEEGDSNVAIGTLSGSELTDGTGNTMIGNSAGDTITTGNYNTAIGYLANVDAATAVNQTVIGFNTTGVADNSVTLGNADVTAVYMASDSGATVHCGDINVQYEYIQVGFNYDQSAGTFVAVPLRAGTRPYTTFAGNLEKCCMIAPHNGTLEVINFRSEEVGGNPVVIGFHKATTGTEVPSDTPTVSTSVDMSGVADDTTTAFAFSLSNAFARGDVLGFSIDPANDINDCLMVITLKYDTTT